MRLIDADALIDYFEEQCEIASQDSSKESLYTLAALKCCVDFFEHFPTIDAVEVVRCKDCRHWKAGQLGYCTKCHSATDYDAFCFQRRKEKPNDKRTDSTDRA